MRNDQFPSGFRRPHQMTPVANFYGNLVAGIIPGVNLDAYSMRELFVNDLLGGDRLEWRTWWVRYSQVDRKAVNAFRYSWGVSPGNDTLVNEVR